MGMKQLVILYSTRTGNTKKLAQGLARELEEFEPVVMERKAGEAVPQAQAYLAGYWADRGHANEEMEIFLKSLKNVKVGLFGTLGAYPYGPHARHIAQAAEDCLGEGCVLLGHFLCQGPVDPALLQRMGAGKPPTPETRRRHAIAAIHPNEADIRYAAALFRERLQAEFLD